MIKLVMARESGDDEFALDYGPDIKYQETREPAPEEINLEDLADLLDFKAENCNAHAFIGCHRGLAAVLFQEVGREAATKAMLALVSHEGLHGLVGARGKGNPEESERRLGVQLSDSRPWGLPGGNRSVTPK